METLRESDWGQISSNMVVLPNISIKFCSNSVPPINAGFLILEDYLGTLQEPFAGQRASNQRIALNGKITSISLVNKCTSCWTVPFKTRSNASLAPSCDRSPNMRKWRVSVHLQSGSWWWWLLYFSACRIGVHHCCPGFVEVAAPNCDAVRSPRCVATILD